MSKGGGRLECGCQKAGVSTQPRRELSQYSVVTYMGRESEKEWLCVHVYLNLCRPAEMIPPL